MKLSKNTVRAIVLLIVVSLAGLTALQYSLLMNIIALKQQTFKQNVYAAMNATAEMLDEIDARNRVFMEDTVVHRRRVPFSGNYARNVSHDSEMVVSIVTTTSRGPGAHGDSNAIRYKLVKPQRVTVKAFDVLGRLDTTFVDTMKMSGTHNISVPSNRFARGIFYVQLRTDSALSTMRWESGKNSYSYTVGTDVTQKEKMIKRIAESVTQLRETSFQERYSKDLVDSILTLSLVQHAVLVPYEFGVMHKDSLVITRTTSVPSELLRAEFRLPLAPGAPFRTSDLLLLRFPGYRSQLLGELLPEFGLSLLLIGVIVFCFVYTIRTILRQKDFAGRLSEFINNMTHEFKTPISTITLASEAIASPDVSLSGPRLERYNAVIAEEIKRMKNQVEKILQMATLEEGGHQFTVSDIDLHQTIAKVVDSLALQVFARNGTIKKQLGAANHLIAADPLHIENVIHNLLDNALKYSESSPDVTVHTADDGRTLVIRIIDRGIGIAKENLDKIFDKYYRVPTGNLHDVKGFGLGLSYVRLVTTAHGGTVTVASQVGRGTTVELRFPSLSRSSSVQEAQTA